MSMRGAKWLWRALIPLPLLLATATPVLADAIPLTLRMQAPSQVRLGETATITAVLRDSKGAPVPRATIVLWSQGSFLSTGGAVEQGKEVTDALGKVAFAYEARTEGTVTLNAFYAGDSRFAPAQSSADLMVQGSEQLYQESPGVPVPGVRWLVAGLLSGVWLIYLTVMVLLSLIAREGSQTSGGAGGSHG